MTTDTHTWAIESVTGIDGPEDVYRCTVCGCSGGRTERMSFWKSGNLPARFEKVARTPEPFLPGPALDLSMNCEVAHQQVHFFVQGYMRSWCFTSRLISQEADARRLLLMSSNRYTPKAVERVRFAQLIWDCDCDQSLRDVEQKLVSMGFRVKSSDCQKCRKPTGRPGDDTNELCYGCEYRTSS